jgi:hypothetical protein
VNAVSSAEFMFIFQLAAKIGLRTGSLLQCGNAGQRHALYVLERGAAAG